MKHYSLAFFLIVFFLATTAVKSQKINSQTFGDSSQVDKSKKYILTGSITDAEGGKPIAGAAIFVDGLKYGNNSDEKGKYFISIAPGKYRFTVRHLGKLPIQRVIGIYANGVVNFEMTERPETLEEVIIRARKDDDNIKESFTGLTKLNISEIKRIPPFMGEVDIVKSLQLLPGITTVGEGSAGFNVRGGRIDQNLILMDGGQIFNSSHALGLLSNFNPDVVENFTLYKGNVPAQFGGRASSVLDVRMKNGDLTKFHVKGGLGLISSRIMLEGPIAKDRTSFIIGSRFSYSDWILKTTRNIDVKQSSASFYDINGNIYHKFNKSNFLNLSFYQGYDYFRYSHEFGYEYSTRLATLNWKSFLSNRWASTFNAVSGDYKSTLYDFNVVTARNLKNGIGYQQLKQNFLYTYEEKNALNLGAEINFYAAKPKVSQPYGPSSTTKGDRVNQGKGRELGLYANEEFTLTEAISVSGGMRYSVFQNLGADTVYHYATDEVRSTTTIIDTTYYASNKVIKTYSGWEPRVSARFNVGLGKSFKASYNRMRQYIHLVSNTTAPTPVDVWQVSNTHFAPQIADNFSLGYFQNFKENMYEGSVEVFYKKTNNIIEYKDFAQILLNHHLETDLLQGKGKSYGAEFFLKKNSGPWTGWLSYTYSRSFIKVDGIHPTEKINNGNWYPTNYDKPHSLSITANHKLGKQARFATNFTYSTGRPITALVSSYLVGSTSVPIYSDRNAYRIPDYWRLDISITLNNIIRKIDDNLTFSVYNLLGRRNAYSVYYQQPAGYSIPQGYKLSILGSALPSITYNFNF